MPHIKKEEDRKNEPHLTIIGIYLGGMNIGGKNRRERLLGGRRTKCHVGCIVKVDMTLLFQSRATRYGSRDSCNEKL